jgi:hypothetical protein
MMTQNTGSQEMVSGFSVTCANKNHNGEIVRVGGQGWSLSKHEAVVKILSKQLRLHIRLDDGNFDIGVRGEGTSAFLVLEPNEIPLHSVEGLPSC